MEGHVTMDPSDGGMDDGGMDHADMGHDMSMKMYFHFSTHAMILFKGWMTHSWAEMLGSCVAIFLLAVLYEGLKDFRGYLQRLASEDPTNNTGETHKESYDTFGKPGVSQSKRSSIWSRWHFLQTLLHFVQVWLSYALMLVFMTFNVYLCICVCLGAGVGYFLFSWKRYPGSSLNEHCN